MSSRVLASKLLTATAFVSTPGAPGGPVVVVSAGPFDLEPGDTVLVDAAVEVTRPMPGDPDAWLWYDAAQRVRYGNPAPDVAYEDHNPAALSWGISRVAGEVDDAPNASDVTVPESSPARQLSANVLQYEHHKALVRSCQDHIAASSESLPGRFYNFIVFAAHAKAGAPAGAYVRVDYAQMQVAVLRG